MYYLLYDVIYISPQIEKLIPHVRAAVASGVMAVPSILIRACIHSVFTAGTH